MILDEMEKERYRVPLLKGSLTKKSQNHTDTLCCTYMQVRTAFQNSIFHQQKQIILHAITANVALIMEQGMGHYFIVGFPTICRIPFVNLCRKTQSDLLRKTQCGSIPIPLSPLVKLKKMFKCCCLQWSMRLATPSQFRGVQLILKETSISTLET